MKAEIYLCKRSPAMMSVFLQHDRYASHSGVSQLWPMGQSGPAAGLCIGPQAKNGFHTFKC